MLTELVVEGLGVIDRAELELAGGSSALTGETGAGKTLLVAALGLLLGARSDKTLVRQGSTEARVDARFVIGVAHPAVGLLAEHGVDLEDGGEIEVVLSRTVGSDGRSKARVNGHLVTLAILQDAGRALVEIAGQNEHHELSNPGAQRTLLDAYGGPKAVELAIEVARSAGDLTDLRSALDDLRKSARDRARELDVLRFEIKEIEDVAPKKDETHELTQQVLRLEHADTIATQVTDAVSKLKGDGGAGELIALAERVTQSLSDKDPGVGEISDRLRSVGVEVADITEELGRRMVQADPGALAAARERLGDLSRLTRKYGATEEDVLGYLAKAKARTEGLEDSGLDEQRLETKIDEVATHALDVATQLSAERKRASASLSKAIEAILKELALGDARFEVALEPRELYAGGLETVGFLIAANMGESPRPLGKVASGGELSRIALALRLLTSTGTASTLVFDEVDAGVGGEAARAVGRCLAELGDREGTQVLVVTHLPQVAAFADHQYRVSKVTTDRRTSSMVEKVEGDARVEELSRMLAGLPESERAREHAQELLELAVREGRG
ncbi:MAG: repair protein RecN [Actinomycetota bacterium]|jgi:DNA repair protein RecN (Recombination protein N)|nr:repair protein RecN [Actinomycetota bacterium]